MKQPSIENRDEGSGLYREYPLDYSQQQIRVLMLHPGAWDDQISCDFCIVSLNDQPAYLALSYVWGQDNPDCVATIGSHQIQIRHNLFSALRRLRAHATGEDTVIWVDAICIDQTSNVERSSQVALMGEIYHQCKAVQVWLGEIEFAHEFWSESPIIKNPGRCYDVGKIADRLKDPIKEEVKYTTPPWRRMTTHRFSGYLKILQDIPEWELLTRMAVFIQLTLRHPPAPVLVSLLNWAPTSGKKQVEHFYKAFQALFENQWFDRLWVVQEVVLAPTVTIFFGPVALSLDAFLGSKDSYDNLIRWPYYTGPYNSLWETLLSTGITKFVEISQFRERIRKQSESTSLLQLRLHLARRLASVDLDQIFSLLGLSDYLEGRRYKQGQMASARPQPNYDQPPQDLYTAISRQHLSSQKSLLALSLSSHANTYPSTPSWAIDWTVLQSDSLKFNYQLWLKINPLFRADRALETKQPYFNHANTTLFLKGYLVDEVVTAIQFGSVSSVNDHIADIMSKLEPGGPYPGKEQTTWADAWFRTIIADSVRCPEVRNLSSPQAALHRMSDDEHEEGFKLRGKFILQTQNPWLPKVDRKEFAPGESNEGKGLWGKYLWYETIPPHAPDQNRLANFARAIRAQAQHITYHRTFFLTRNGYIGIANKCKPSDEIYIASCGNMPIVLEKVVGAFKERWNAVEQTGSDKIIENHHFRVVGDCYLHGFMDGEHNERLLRECGRLSLLAIV